VSANIQERGTGGAKGGDEVHLPKVLGTGPHQNKGLQKLRRRNIGVITPGYAQKRRRGKNSWSKKQQRRQVEGACISEGSTCLRWWGTIETRV